MPQHRLHTRSKKRSRVKLPGGRNTTHYGVGAHSTPSCTLCGQPIAGVPHLTESEGRKLNRSKRRVWRPYGGQICHNCLKNSLKQAARNI